MKKNKSKMTYSTRFNLRFLMGIITNVVILGFLNVNFIKQLYQPYIGGLTNEMNRFDMFFTQISVSFIIISLVSVLSTTTKIVYWVDISQYKLVEPKYTGFIDFAAYILSCLAVSTICVLSKSNMILVPFIISIVLLALLTVKMIGSYFGRDSVKRELRDRFIKLKEISSTEYSEVESTLIENTYKEIDSKDYQLIEENVDLLMECQEYDSYIYIMEYMGEALPDLFCKLMKKYDGTFKSVRRSVSDKYYKLVLANLIRFIANGRVTIFTQNLFDLYLNGRLNQIDSAISAYEELTEKEPRKKMNIYRHYLDLDRYGMGKIYAECVKNDDFELLNEFLSKYYEKMNTMSHSIENYYDTDQSFAERLKQIYIVDFEIKKIVVDLEKKIQADEIDGRQINNILRTLIDIYCRIEKIENDEIKKANKKMFDTLSYEVLKECFKEIIEATADAGLLTAWTYQSKRRCSSEYIKKILESVSSKAIDTV